MPDVSGPVALWLARRISAPVALARLVLDGTGPDALRTYLASQPDTAELLALFEAHKAGIGRLAAMRSHVDHGSAANVDQIAAQFDRAVEIAPGASVAAYTLDDAGLLAGATAELVAWLRMRGLLAAGADVVDLGCGHGRVAAALVPPARHVLGLDASACMVAEARRRFAGRPELCFRHVEGRDLAHLPPRSCDLLLAVDSFPYLFQAGVAERHIRDASLVLRPGGALVAFNLSYAADAARDIGRTARWAIESGLRPEEQGRAPLTLWDAGVFVYRAPGRLG